MAKKGKFRNNRKKQKRRKKQDQNSVSFDKHPAYRGNFGLEKVPIYETIDPNFVIIGITHEPIDPKKVSFERMVKFAQTVVSLDALLLEGCERSHQWIVEAQGVRGFEQFALTRHKGPVYYLEEGSNLVHHLSERGLSEEMVALYTLLARLPWAISEASQYEDSEAALREINRIYFEHKRAGNLPFDTVSFDETNERMGLLIQANGEASWPQLAQAATFYSNYEGMVRETLVLAPEAMRIREELDGRKGLVFGAAHVDYVARRMQGKPTCELPDWPTFVAGLKPEDRAWIEKVESQYRRE